MKLAFLTMLVAIGVVMIPICLIALRDMWKHRPWGPNPISFSTPADYTLRSIKLNIEEIKRDIKKKERRQMTLGHNKRNKS